MAKRPKQIVHPFPSTTWEWRRVKIKPPARAPEGQRPKGHRFSGLSPWNKRQPLTLTVRYNGGAEAWVEVKSRGRTARYPGHLCLIDVLHDVWQDGYPSTGESQGY